MHFFLIPREEREAKAACSSFPPCPNDNVSAAIYSYPPSRFVADDFYLEEVTFGGHGSQVDVSRHQTYSCVAAPRHGMHWLYRGDMPLGVPDDEDSYSGGGPPRWLDCLTQVCASDQFTVLTPDIVHGCS